MGQRSVKVLSEVHLDIPENPQRIVSLTPSITEMLCDLGLFSRIVGVSAFCARPEQIREKRKVGSFGSFRDEVMEQVNPDIVFLESGFQDPLMTRLSEKYKVVSLPLPRNVADILSWIWNLGLITDRLERANSLIGELSLLIHPHVKRKVRGYLEIDLGGPVTFGYYSYITNTMSMYGIETPYEKTAAEWMKPDDDALIRFDPEIIFYEPKMFSRFTENDLERIIEERGWENTTAYRNCNIYSTPGPLDFFAHHGTSFITETIPWMEKHIEELFNTVK
ncbi:MAG: ABC transporter substrate-binding protein [Candidatus Thermoplasmatota archaeon]|nr:ABC transporter substrate-binding protein [Candidatus Thermoplasmatota archaeon]MCL5731543.1 ABC transporter substrate-binding protein [Candidatus Thermoplasmatota archaeon]